MSTDMTTANKPQRVLVIGAGIVGLLIAQGLKKEGIACTVFEAEPSASHYRPREWGMSIQWGLPLLATCFTPEKYDKIHTAAVDPNYVPENPGRMPTLNGATGENIKDIPLLRMYRVSRRRFRTFCVEGIDVQYGKSIKDITYSEDGKFVTAHFQDGTSETGSLLVGTDGTHSPTRRLLFHDQPAVAEAQTVPYYAINTHVCYKDASKAEFMRRLHPIMYHGVHPKGYWLFLAIQDVPDPNDPATWVYQMQCTWKKSTEPDTRDEDITNLEMHKQRADMFGEPFKSGFQWMPEDTKLYANKMAYWIPQSWDSRNGRVILAGDAAHPMTFQRGQGLNHGIADAASLTNLLKTVKNGQTTQQDAVNEYIEEMVTRAGEECKLSVKNTDMLHDWDRFMSSPIMARGGHANLSNKQVAENARNASVPEAGVAAANTIDTK